MERTRTATMGALVGPSLALAVAGVLAPARDWLGTTNVALLLVVVVAATSSFSDRTGAVVTAVVAALAYNFFHTRPYYTLRVDDRVDLTTVGLVLVVGLVCSELTVLRRRRADQAAARAEELARWRALVSTAASGDDARLVEMATATVRDELDLIDCRFEPAGHETGDSVLLGPDGSIATTHLQWTTEGFALPEAGVHIPVTHGSTSLGRLVLVPRPGVGVSLERRRLASAVADLLATASAGKVETRR